MQFTYEIAKDHQMSFLDVWIDSSSNKFYRKPTNTGRYMNWQSFVPLRYKLNLIKSLLHRAYVICNSYNLIRKDFFPTKR